MKLISLDLINFRNYESLHLELDPGVNLIVGNNAQGKTNLLESVVYLSQSASYRTRKEEELIRWNQDFARLEAKIQGQDRETELVYGAVSGPPPPSDYEKRRSAKISRRNRGNFDHGAVLPGGSPAIAGRGSSTPPFFGQRHPSASATI